MIVLIDNYDSFTYNLLQYLQMLGQVVSVYQNDRISCEEIQALNPQKIVISPGPHDPLKAGISLALIERFYQHIPLLGICLGHQCIAHYFGARIIGAGEIFHGRTSIIEHHSNGLFKDIPNHFKATRYHSLAVAPESLPQCLRVDAWTSKLIMAISHRSYPVFGVQFHPEAILSEHGLALLNNFLNIDYSKKINPQLLQTLETPDL